MKTTRIAPALLVAACLTGPASAQESRNYFGLAIGQNTVDPWDRSAIDDGSLTSSDADDADVGFHLMGGLEFNENLAVEVGYTDFGEATADGTSDGTGFFWAAGPVSAKSSATGWDLGALGRIPVGQSTLLYARLGVLLWDYDASLGDSTGTLSGGDDGNDTFFGIGAEFRTSETLALRFDFIQYKIDDFDIDTLALGLIYRPQ